jgi:hypothetical protein
LPKANQQWEHLNDAGATPPNNYRQKSSFVLELEVSQWLGFGLYSARLFRWQLKL